MLGKIVADRALPDGRHLVIADDDSVHRLWLPDPDPGRPLAIMIPNDDHALLRSAIAHRLVRRMDGLRPGPLPAAFQPTPFQRQRLTLLLNLLDAYQARAGRREMASVIVYPRMRPLTGREWAASAERRRTQRLLDEARAIMSGGYRALLLGVERSPKRGHF